MKAIGIFLVILGHQPLTNNTLHDWIFSFHIPLFFFISGFLAKVNYDNVKFIKTNLMQLILVIIPYFIVNTIFTGMQDYLFYHSDFSLQHNLVDKIEKVVLGESTMGPMWFLLALFWMRLVYNWGLQLIKQYTYIIILSISIITSFIAYYMQMNINYYQITAFLLGFPFYCFGALFKQIDIIEIIKIKKYSIIYAIIFLCLSLLLLRFAGSINLNALNTGNNIVLYYMSGLVGILSIMAFCQNLPSKKIITTISEGTLVILGLHMVLIQAFKLLYKKICDINLPPPYMDSISAIVISFIILIILYYPIRLILNSKKKSIRFLAGKK